MLKECLNVFAKMLEEKGEDLILDEYIPADGSYMLISADGKIKDVVDVKLDKKSRCLEDISSEFLKAVFFYDYHSRLLSMNKPIDSKKVIHSNNYLSFTIKKESLKNGKLTKTIIDNYYHILKNPLLKYSKSKEASQIYKQFADEYGGIDEQNLEKCSTWINEHIFNLADIIPDKYELNLDKKDYLKIFFEISHDHKVNEELYRLEDNRYIMSNIYNNNSFNLECNGAIYGLPDNNISMNAKKPFLANRTRKNPIPYLLDGKDVLLQKKFFDYLMNKASLAKFNIYVDTNKTTIHAYTDKENPNSIESGCYLRIKKGKELEIAAQDNISGYSDDTKRDFILKHIVNYNFFDDKYSEDYDTPHSQRSIIGGMINDILFSKYLKTNYFTDAADLKINDSVLKCSLLTYRDAVFNWVYKGIDNDFAAKIDKCAAELLKNSIISGYRDRAVRQMDMRRSLIDYFRGEDTMTQMAEEIRRNLKDKVLLDAADKISSDAEYCYAVGQLAGYFISLSKASKKPQSMIKPFLNAANDALVKNRLRSLYNKYAYTIADGNRRLKNLYAMVLAYSPKKIDEDMLLLGYLDNNCIYTKTKAASNNNE